MFQSTHSLRSATWQLIFFVPSDGFQSTHSLRSATRPFLKHGHVQHVSIHALLAECDSPGNLLRSLPACFNPRTPCGVRLAVAVNNLAAGGFQSTHSLRSATYQPGYWEEKEVVSIHALLAECDWTETPQDLPRCFVSIHALLAECDSGHPDKASAEPGFNPRTPCGVRLRLTIYIVIQQRKRYFAPTSRRRPSSPSLLF